ncbi:hypothetical protein CC86DRAFT_413211, partial [Ophiobolus disseminans]
MKGNLVLLLGSLATASPLLAERGYDHGYDACPSETCKVKGYPGRCEPYKVLTDRKWCSPAACGELCAAEKKCKTSAVSEWECRLYDDDIRKAMWTSLRVEGPYEFSSKCCSGSGKYGPPPSKPPQYPEKPPKYDAPTPGKPPKYDGPAPEYPGKPP